MRARALLLTLLLSGLAFGQGVSFQGPKIESQVPQPLAGLTITACLATSSGTPCTPAVSVFSDSALTVPIVSLQTDGDGQIPLFFITPGQYQWCASDPVGLRIAAYCTKFSAPAVAGSSPSFLNLTVTGSTSLGLVTSLGNVQWVTGASDFASKMTLACNGTVPGTVWMPIGSTVTVNPKAIPSNCTVKCPSPWACKLTLANASNANFFTQASAVAANIVIEDMIIDGNQANQSGTSSCMYFQTVSGLHVQHNIIQNCRNHAVFVDGCQTYVGSACTVPVPSSNIWVENNIISAPILGHGVELGNGPAPADTVVQNFHVRGNTILHTSAALVNGIFTLGATSVGVCGTGPGDITNNIINGANDTGIEVGQGSCQVTVTGNNVSLGAANGTTGIGIRSAQEVTVTGNQVHGDGVHTTEFCYFFWNNSGNDDLQFKAVVASNNVGKGCTAASSFDIAVNAGNAGTAGVGNGLKITGSITDGGPASYNYLSLPTNFDAQGNDDERYNSSRSKPARATQDSAGDGFYPYAAPLFQGSSPLNIEMRTSNVALPGGLYRFVISGSQWLLQRNTAAAGDFSSSSTELGDDGSGNFSVQQGQFIAQGIGGFRDTSLARFDEGTPGGAIAGGDVCQGNSTTHTFQCSYNNGSFFSIPQTIGSGTATMTTAGITTGACGTTVTVAATGVLTTDVINATRNAAATIGNGGGLTLNAWPTAGNVNFNYCNSSAGTITPTAMTVNWTVVR